MIDFTLLDPTFAVLARNLLVVMKDKGYGITPTAGLRSLEEQARLYRRSRSTAQINATVAYMRGQGCDYIADIIDSVGPQKTGPWATNAFPGESYHGFGLAMDVLLSPGSDSDYKIYADEAQKLGLTSGYYFTMARDGGHVQLGSEPRPHGYTLKQCNDYFEANIMSILKQKG